MNKCPRCDRYTLDYFSLAQTARCLSCGYSQKVATRDEFYAQFPNGRTVTAPGENRQAGTSAAGTSPT